MPLGVFGALRVPHCEPVWVPSHVTLQFTPALVESFETTAVSELDVPCSSSVGGAGLKTMETAPPVPLPLPMVTRAVTNWVSSATAVAVIVTVPPVGAVAGAV